MSAPITRYICLPSGKCLTSEVTMALPLTVFLLTWLTLVFYFCFHFRHIDHRETTESIIRPGTQHGPYLALYEADKAYDSNARKG